jgi:hypothetical protein
MILRYPLALLLLLTMGAALACPRPRPRLPERDARPLTVASSRFSGSDTLIAQLIPAMESGLRASRELGKLPHVTAADLLALALVLEAPPESETWPWNARLEEGERLLGTTTVGPWAITLDQTRLVYGPEFGVDPKWPDEQVLEYIMDRPPVQVQMAADRLQRLYIDHGTRSAAALQLWRAQTVPPDPAEWRSVMAELTTPRDSFAWSMLLGTAKESRGLLFWLATSGDEAEIRRVVTAWRDAPAFEWNLGAPVPIRADRRTRIIILPSDLSQMRSHVAEFALAHRVVGEVNATAP